MEAQENIQLSIICQNNVFYKKILLGTGKLIRVATGLLTPSNGWLSSSRTPDSVQARLGCKQVSTRPTQASLRTKVRTKDSVPQNRVITPRESYYLGRH